MKAHHAGTLLTLVEGVGDLHLKYYAKGGGMVNLVIGTASYIALEVILIEALKTNDLAITNGYWDGLSNILNTGIGIYAGENLTTKQITGLVLISGGLLLL
jgi:multidrug transporter EmrE-like cation transporter